MTLLTIWRIEHKCTRLGPYWGCVESKWMARDHCSPRHPCPENDGLVGGVNPDDYLGFISLAQLRAWFDCQQENMKLRELGFVAVKYAVPEVCVRVLETQAVFYRPRAVKISTDLPIPKGRNIIAPRGKLP